MGTYLDRIVDAHRQACAADRRSVDDLVRAARSEPPARDLRAALAEDEAMAVIAEVKRRSPSRGDLHPDLDPASVAHSYEAGGAAALSVLTDTEFFGGSAADLRAARAAVTLPVLRKDFTVSALDVADARLMGADAVLLIVAALSPGELGELASLSVELGMTALVEVHDEHEVEVALSAGADLIGVNQRDLHSFTVDTDRAVRVGAAIPDGVIRVAESGIRGAEDVVRLARAGYHAVLVGESLVTAADPTAMLHAMRHAV